LEETQKRIIFSQISITYIQAWAGLSLHSAAPPSTAEYDLLRFWIHGGSSGGQALRVVASVEVHSINPYIYGMNFAGQSLATELGLPVSRWGGNGTTPRWLSFGSFRRTEPMHQCTNPVDCNAATQALRLRSTRSLWDPNYPDESWIDGTEGGPTVRLIPRMRDWVASNYPGTKLTITEYNWGALDHIDGALVYWFSAANLTAIQRAPDQPVGSSGFSATFPSNSITLFVIPPSEPPPTLSGCRGYQGKVVRIFIGRCR